MIEVISIVGCSVSIVCLLITLSAHMVVWRYVDFTFSFCNVSKAFICIKIQIYKFSMTLYKFKA